MVKSRWYRPALEEASRDSERKSPAPWGWAYSSHEADQLSVKRGPKDCWDIGRLSTCMLEKSQWPSVDPRLKKDVELNQIMKWLLCETIKFGESLTRRFLQKDYKEVWRVITDHEAL